MPSDQMVVFAESLSGAKVGVPILVFAKTNIDAPHDQRNRSRPSALNWFLHPNRIPDLHPK